MAGKKAERRRRNLDRMRAYIATLQPPLRLQHWEITIPEKPPPDDSNADCDRHSRHHAARIRYHDQLFPEGAEEERRSTIHELLHLHLTGAQTAAYEAYEALDPTARAWARERFDHELEMTVDALSRVLAPFLPLPPGGA
jgi:hypothetical protein